MSILSWAFCTSTGCSALADRLPSAVASTRLTSRPACLAVRTQLHGLTFPGDQDADRQFDLGDLGRMLQARIELVGQHHVAGGAAAGVGNGDVVSDRLADDGGGRSGLLDREPRHRDLGRRRLFIVQAIAGGDVGRVVYRSGLRRAEDSPELCAFGRPATRRASRLVACLRWWPADRT